MDILRESACYPERNEHILGLLKERSSKWKPTSCLIFIGVGSGYHEWKAIELFKENLWDIEEVIFTERLVDREWLRIWTVLAQEHDIKFTFVRSYQELLGVVYAEKFVVIYINGTFFFSKSTCGNYFKDEKEAAVDFWKICDESAVNNIECMQAYWEEPVPFPRMETLLHAF
jgi:hypothetical protein